jgi:hypothetical protein
MIRILPFLRRPESETESPGRIGRLHRGHGPGKAFLGVLEFRGKQVFAGNPDFFEKVDAALGVIDGVVDSAAQQGPVAPNPFRARQHGDEVAPVPAAQVIPALFSVHAPQGVGMEYPFAARILRRARETRGAGAEACAFGLDGKAILAVAAVAQEVIAQQVFVLPAIDAQILVVHLA